LRRPTRTEGNRQHCPIIDRLASNHRQQRINGSLGHQGNGLNDRGHEKVILFFDPLTIEANDLDIIWDVLAALL
jgi:hypothetical protein